MEDRIPNRKEGRIITLEAAIQKSSEFLKTLGKKDARRIAAEMRLSEYETSLKNLTEHGRERLHTAPAGASIGVPVDTLVKEKRK